MALTNLLIIDDHYKIKMMFKFDAVVNHSLNVLLLKLMLIFTLAMGSAQM